MRTSRLTAFALMCLLAACGGGGGGAASNATAAPTLAPSGAPALPTSLPEPLPAPIVLGANECNDGLDNDADGLADWQMDLGCENAAGTSERAGSRAQKNGFTTFDPDANSVVIFVSSSGGNDANNGRTPQTAVRSITRGAALVRSGQYDFLLLKRGDVWRDQKLGRFKSGRDATHPLVLGSYGASQQRPRVETKGPFIEQAGERLDNVAILGLEFFGYVNDPGDAAFTGDDNGGIDLIGFGDNLLLEDNKFTYSELIIQSYNPPDTLNRYRNVQVRRNVVSLSYHVNTCGQNSAFRPSGTYASGVRGLLFEGNIYDHNGWNESVASACATMYNHNFYLDAYDLTMRDNLITRGSSMGIKTVAYGPAGAQRFLFENNFLYDGEIGISAGGNVPGPYRYADVTVRGNVFSEIGKSNNTQRSFSWALTLSDNDRTLVESNYFLHQPWYTNSLGIHISQSTMRDVTVRANTFYNINGNAVQVNSQSDWSNVRVSENRFLAPPSNACMVNHSGSFSAVAYADNQYASAGEFCLGNQRQTLAQWRTASGETNAQVFTGSLVDPTRTLSTYATAQGYANINAFLAATQTQSRLDWRPALTANAVNDYIRAGFAVQ